MATKAASKRLGKEQQIMEKDPPPFCYARPREDNVLEWHFILRGPPDTPYHGGEFWGQLTFPSDYPFKPPGIKMSTPSGRFKPDTKICTSMSDFHPGSWNPSWSVANILVGLLSFMCADEMTTGSVSATPEDRKTFAKQSHGWNIKQKKFTSLFPEYSTPEIKDLPNMGQRPAPPAAPPADGGAAAAATSKVSTSASAAGRASADVAAASSSSSATGGVTRRPGAANTRAAGSAKAAPAPAPEAAAAAAAAAAGANPPGAGGAAGLFAIGRRKLAIGIAVLAYLFVSRLMSHSSSATSGSSATGGA